MSSDPELPVMKLLRSFRRVYRWEGYSDVDLRKYVVEDWVDIQQVASGYSLGGCWDLMGSCCTKRIGKERPIGT